MANLIIPGKLQQKSTCKQNQKNLITKKRLGQTPSQRFAQAKNTTLKMLAVDEFEL